MVQLVLLIKRKPGMTKEEFKAHYESSHAPMAMKHMGHLVKDYRRNYTAKEYALDGQKPSSMDPQYDAVTVITFASDEDFDEFFRIASSPGIAEEFIEDEFAHLDRSQVVFFKCYQEFTPPL